MGLALARETTKNGPEDVKTQWSKKRLPHNFEAIVKEADDDQGDLLRILRSGIFLNHKKKKYWVDESGYNCFTVYARDLSITWSSEQRYWHWVPLNDSSSEADIAVASLQNVCWLEVQGKLDASHLSPGVTYEVAFIVMMKDSSYGWNAPVTLNLECLGGDKQVCTVRLDDNKFKNQWSKLLMGTFSTSKGMQGDIKFSMFECGAWKRGLVIKGAVIQPAKSVED